MKKSEGKNGSTLRYCTCAKNVITVRLALHELWVVSLRLRNLCHLSHKAERGKGSYSRLRGIKPFFRWRSSTLARNLLFAMNLLDGGYNCVNYTDAYEFLFGDTET